MRSSVALPTLSIKNGKWNQRLCRMNGIQLLFQGNKRSDVFVPSKCAWTLVQCYLYDHTDKCTYTFCQMRIVEPLAHHTCIGVLNVKSWHILHTNITVVSTALLCLYRRVSWNSRGFYVQVLASTWIVALSNAKAYDVKKTTLPIRMWFALQAFCCRAQISYTKKRIIHIEREEKRRNTQNKKRKPNESR